MHPDQIKQMIEQGLPGARVDVSGDGRHFEAVVVSDSFRGCAALKRHRMVYATLGDQFDTDALHALSVKTYTPEQWQSLRD